MSIASEISRINDNIASAYTGLASKGAEIPLTENSANLRAAIDSIPFNASVGRKDVNFYDCDGTCLYSYSKAEWLSGMSPVLPELPSRRGLVCQCWNRSLSEITNYVSEYGRCDTGAVYITDDGSTRLYISIPNSLLLSPALYLKLKEGSLTIDWGDDTLPTIISRAEPDYANVSSTHDYQMCGDYVISLSFSGSGSYKLGQGSAVTVLGEVTASAPSLFPYVNMLKKVEIGQSCEPEEYAFSHCYSLNSVTIPLIGDDQNGIKRIAPYAFYSCGRICFISLPSSVESIGRNAFASCSGLSTILIPSSIETIGGVAFQYCRVLNSFILPRGLSVLNTYLFSYCFSLVSLILPNTVTQINANAFLNSYNLTELDMSAFINSSEIPALSNINAFSGTSLTRILVASNTMKAAFEAATNWNSFSGLFTVK